jgi:hypothetical protein
MTWSKSVTVPADYQGTLLDFLHDRPEVSADLKPAYAEPFWGAARAAQQLIDTRAPANDTELVVNLFGHEYTGVHSDGLERTTIALGVQVTGVLDPLGAPVPDGA